MSLLFVLRLIFSDFLQIRAQLSAIGAPILGDSMYMPSAIAEMVNPRINPFGKFTTFSRNENDKEIMIKEWVAKYGKDPSVAIGLQACQISWDDGDDKCIYKAGHPWWRSDE